MIGTVSLVGAGLGDPELLTAKALRKISQADVIVYDRLVNPELLNFCQANVEKINVGKQPTHHPVPQKEIEQILVAKAKAGHQVVRLKSGDPYVFGRGGEEGSTLYEAGIPFEVIPGITSAIGGLAYGGIPVTHRNCASSFHVITGHLKSEKDEFDWDTLAKMEGTLVFLMGMSELEHITTQLIQHGKLATTPAAVIQWASRKEQRTAVADLSSIYQVAHEKGLGAPSLIVIGEVVELRASLNFFETRPFFGKSIGMPYTELKKMNHRLGDLGATVREFPKPKLKKLASIDSVGKIKKMVITDGDSVKLLQEALFEQQKDWRDLQYIELGAVGHNAIYQLKQVGILPDLEYQDLNEFIQGSQITEVPTLVIGESQLINQLQLSLPESSQLEFWQTHEWKLPNFEKNYWQNEDWLYFPHSKAARMFINSLTEQEIQALKQKTILVMGEQTKGIFDQYKIPVIQSEMATSTSVIASCMKLVK